MASRFSAIKDAVNLTNRNKRNVSTGSSNSQQTKPSRSSTVDTFTTSLTVFQIKKEITSKQLQNEEICALTVCKNLIYLATKSGRISIFEERVNQQSSRRSSSNVRSHIKHKRSAEYKKAKNIKQMAVCLDVNIMILVLNNGHYLCMDALNLVEYTDTKKKKSLLPLNKTKNAERIIPSFSRPHYRFAIASKKNLYVFEWNKSKANYSFVCDISTGEPCVSCVFYNNKLCFSTHKRGFVMHDVKADTDTKINVPSMANNIPRMYQISHRMYDKDDGHLLVQASPNLMIFIDKTGNPAQKDTVNWSSTPLFVIDCKQYMMGYLENKQIEIISLVDQKAVQILNIKERSILGMYRSVSDRIIIYDNYEVLSLVSTPMHEQISECIKHLRIEKGLKLLMNDGVGPTQNELRAFQAEAGFALLCNLQWKRCMEHFEISDVDPRDIIYLFADIKFSGFEYEIQHASAPRDCTIGDIIGRILRERANKYQSYNYEEEARNEYLHSIYYLAQFLWKRRSDPSSDDFAIVGAELKLCVDTALLKIYVELVDAKYSLINASHKGRCAPFAIEDLLDCECVNACVESECEKLLISHQQYYNLALFYRSKGKLEKALHCLYCIGATKEWAGDVDDAIELSIDILALMNGQHLWTYAEWVLKSKPLQAMTIFTHSKRADSSHALWIEFDKVIQYLCEDIQTNAAFDYNEYYFEFIVSSPSGSTEQCNAKYHDELAYLYMKKIQKLIRLSNDTLLDVTRDKLLKFLEKSQLISPAKLLQHAKKFQLYDEIIELNKKLANHCAVLYTLVIDKADHAQAIQYCMETAPASADRSDRFLELLRLYFDTQKTDKAISKEECDVMPRAQPKPKQRRQTINIELLQQELIAANNDDPFMVESGAGGMNFDFDELDDDEDDDAEEMKDQITELPFQMPTRARNRGITEQASKDEARILFDKGVDILLEYAFEIDYLSVLEILPSDKDVMYFSRYIAKIIPFIVHKRRITKIKKNLHKRQYLRQRINVAKAQSVAVRMDRNSICTKCDKNIGQAVFILDPKTHNKFHYSCFYRKRAPKNKNIIISPFPTTTTNDNDNNPFSTASSSSSVPSKTNNPFQSDLLDNTNPFS
eukprot:141117_1